MIFLISLVWMSKLRFKYWTHSSVEFSHINAGSRYISAICNFSNLNLFCQFEKWKVKPCYDFSLSSYPFPRYLLTCIKNLFWHDLNNEKKNYNLIIKNPWIIPHFFDIYYYYFFFFELLPSVLYSNFVIFFLIVMVTMKIARYNAKAKFNFWSHQSARDTEQDERIFCPNSLLYNGIIIFFKLHMPCDFTW